RSKQTVLSRTQRAPRENAAPFSVVIIGSAGSLQRPCLCYIQWVMSHIRKSAPSDNEFFEGHHRFEHWYVDNQVYFLTARVRDKKLAFASEEAKAIFWDRFDHYTTIHH